MPFTPLRWHVDIDQYLNPFVPPSLLPRLPYPVAHFLGHRTGRSLRTPLGNIVVIFWAFVGVFGTLSFIGLIGRHIPAFESRGVPTIVGSFVSFFYFFMACWP